MSGAYAHTASRFFERYNGRTLSHRKYKLWTKWIREQSPLVLYLGQKENGGELYLIRDDVDVYAIVDNGVILTVIDNIDHQYDIRIEYAEERREYRLQHKHIAPLRPARKISAKRVGKGNLDK